MIELDEGYLFTDPANGVYSVDLNNPLEDATINANAVGGPGTIIGQLFLDSNGNGLRDDNEPVRTGRVYIDSNNNGLWDDNEILRLATTNGTFSFNNLDDGIYTIREDADHWYESTLPGDGSREVNLVSAQGSWGNDFGVQVTAPDHVPNDFNGDGKADILYRDPVTGRYSVWFMDGNARIGSAQLPVTGPAWDIGGTGDFNHDGQADIIWRNRNDGSQILWIMDDSLGFVPSAMAGPAPVWELKGVGDVNADGFVDLIYRNKTSGAVTAWKMNGVQPYDVPNRYEAVAFIGDLNWDIKAVADFDGDGHADLFWTNSATNQANIWLMDRNTIKPDGFRGFTRPADPAWKLLAVQDFNNDGTKDLLWGNGKAGSIWKLTGLESCPLQIAFDNANIYDA